MLFVVSVSKEYVSVINSPAWKCVDVVSPFVDHLLDELMEGDKIQRLLSSKEHYDVIFTEFFFGQEFIAYLGQVFNAPVIFLQPLVTTNLVNGVFGNALSLSYIPDICVPFSNKMTVFERFLNSLYMLRGLYYVYYQKYMTNLESKYKKHFPDAPSISEMVNNVSMVFVNDHPTADYAQPRTPNIIPIAGIHIGDTQDLAEVSMGQTFYVIYFKQNMINVAF